MLCGLNLLLHTLSLKKKYQLSVRIDKLTRCIEEVHTGKNISTEVLPVSLRELKSLKKREWLFNWSLEARDPLKNLYMLVKIPTWQDY